MFKVIENKQTPKLEAMTTEQTLKFIKSNKDKLEKFLNHVKDMESAVGLASNQCGMKERFFASMTNRKTNDYTIFINPIIVRSFGGTFKDIEGCLSWPDKLILAERHRNVEVEYFNLEGKYVSEVFTGFPAQIIQHEVDHLNGVEEEVVDKDYKIDSDFKTVKREQPKVGRNEPCPCGSGKKFKKCHG